MITVKLIQHNVLEERHELTKLLRMDMFEMRARFSTIKVVHTLMGRMFGLVEAYYRLGIIDLHARMLYIQIITDAAWKREEELINEI